VVPVLLLGCAAVAPGQEAADTGSVGQAKLAVINMARISSESLIGKSYAAKIEKLDNEIKTASTQKQAELEKLDTEIATLKDELQKQLNVLSAEGRDKKAQEIRTKERTRQAFLEDGQAEIQRMQERARQQAQNLNNEFQLKIRPHIQAVAKEKGIDILLDSSAALAMTDSFDISRFIIAKADEAERSGAQTPAAETTPAPAPTPDDQ
jgi:Skp family chaperone for outer membrane proteins